MKKRTRSRLLFWVIMASGGILRLWGIGRPWDTTHDGWCGAFYTIAAENYLRFGYFHSRLGMNSDAGEAADPGSPTLYANHPPTLSLVLSLVLRITGRVEWGTRLVPTLFGIACIAVVWGIGRRLYGNPVGLWSAAIFAVLPMQTFFGSYANVQGPVDLFLILAAVYLYIRLVQTGRDLYFVYFLVCFVLAGLVEWVAFYFLPLLFLLMVWDRTIRDWRKLAVLWVVGLLLFAGLSGYLGWLAGDPFHAFHRLIHRASVPGGDRLMIEESFGVGEWIERLWATNRDWHLVPVLVLGAAFVVVSLLRPGGHKARHGKAANWVLFLLAFGFFHIIVGFEGAYHHRFWSLYLSPGLSIAAAWYLVALSGAVADRGRLRGPVALVLLFGIGTTVLPGDSDFVATRGPVLVGISAVLLAGLVTGMFFWKRGSVAREFRRYAFVFSILSLVLAGGLRTFFAKVPDPYVREFGRRLRESTEPGDVLYSATEVGHQARFYARREISALTPGGVPEGIHGMESLASRHPGKRVLLLFVRSTRDGTLDAITSFVAGLRPAEFDPMFALYRMNQAEREPCERSD